ncbi:MAG: pyridoxamine 5'-phosphate oxidase family protein [Alistipes sp.]|nr:pyridoxamine 5'-phosphate oxidase family protein [Candidatus Alistipes equi]
MTEKSIDKFIKSHHVMALSTVDENGLPYSCAIFYAYNDKENILIFSSEKSTAHASHFEKNPFVAFSIYLETNIVGKIKGVQGKGKVTEASATDRMTYIKRFPYAAIAPLTLWRIEPTFFKLTDNSLLGFGKKLIWNKQE